MNHQFRSKYVLPDPFFLVHTPVAPLFLRRSSLHADDLGAPVELSIDGASKTIICKYP